MAETVRERSGPSFYLTEDTLDVISVAVELDAVAETFLAGATDEIVGVVDEKHGVSDVGGDGTTDLEFVNANTRVTDDDEGDEIDVALEGLTVDTNADESGGIGGIGGGSDNSDEQESDESDSDETDNADNWYWGRRERR